MDLRNIIHKARLPMDRTKEWPGSRHKSGHARNLQEHTALPMFFMANTKILVVINIFITFILLMYFGINKPLEILSKAKSSNNNNSHLEDPDDVSLSDQNLESLNFVQEMDQLEESVSLESHENSDTDAPDWLKASTNPNENDEKELDPNRKEEDETISSTKSLIDPVWTEERKHMQTSKAEKKSETMASGKQQNNQEPNPAPGLKLKDRLKKPNSKVKQQILSKYNPLSRDLKVEKEVPKRNLSSKIVKTSRLQAERNMAQIGEWLPEAKYTPTCFLKGRNPNSQCCDPEKQQMHFEFEDKNLRNEYAALTEFTSKVQGKNVTIMGDSIQKNLFMALAELTFPGKLQIVHKNSFLNSKCLLFDLKTDVL